MLSAPRDDSTALTSDEADRWLSSTRLISRAQLPDLLEQHRPLLKRIAEKEVPAYLLARFDSSDVVQETLLKAYHHFDQFAGQTDAEFVGWMRGILLNQIVDTIRHHGRQIRDLARDRSMPPGLECEKSFTASDLVQKQELSDRLLRALKSMPEDYQNVLRLRHEQGLGFPEIGQQMQRTADAARMLWGRAVVRLAKIMQGEEGNHFWSFNFLSDHPSDKKLSDKQ